MQIVSFLPQVFFFSIYYLTSVDFKHHSQCDKAFVVLYTYHFSTLSEPQSRGGRFKPKTNYLWIFTYNKGGPGKNGHFFLRFELRLLGHLQIMTNRLKITNLQKKLQNFCRQTSCLQNEIRRKSTKTKKIKFIKVDKYETKVVINGSSYCYVF